EEFFDQIVFFIVESCAAEMSDGLVLHQGLAVLLLDKASFARLPETIGDHVHRPLERNLFPFSSEWTAILHGHQSLGMGMEFLCVGTFRTEASARNGRIGVALDLHDVVAL